MAFKERMEAAGKMVGSKQSESIYTKDMFGHHNRGYTDDADEEVYKKNRQC